MNLAEMTVKEIREGLKSKKFTSRELVYECLRRIEKYDRCEGGYNSVLEINPDAFFIADAADAQIKRGIDLGPLHGIPVLIKDNIGTADKMQTTAGSLALAGNISSYDAEVADRIRKGGGVILGKTNMTEFANYMSPNMKNGYSSRGGQVINALNQEADASGSSTGSAVAAALSLSPVTVGTETSGSIISPSAANGVVGIKPTMGLIGRSGIIPISNTLDTAGPMGKTVYDTAALLSILAGEDAKDPATWEKDRLRSKDYTRFLNDNGFKGKRIAINAYGWEEMAQEDKSAFMALIKAFERRGAAVFKIEEFSNWDCIMDIMKYEFKNNLNAVLAGFKGAKCSTLKEIIAFNKENPEDCLKYGQEILEEAENQASGRLMDEGYFKAIFSREKAVEKLYSLFDKNRADVILCTKYNNMAPMTGFPSMTIPIGQRSDKTNIPAFFIAKPFEEALVIQTAYIAEQELKIKLKKDFI